MSGHSKWATIKRKKGAADAKRGQTFTKYANAIALAAREGSDADTNYKLRLAIDKAKAVNMPQNNIQRAIERGSGVGGATRLEEVTYEGYGPSGVAVLVSCATDNKNRTSAEVRSLFSKSGGRLAEPGSVAYQFKQKGIIHLDTSQPDDASLVAIDKGAEDIEIAGSSLIVYTSPTLLSRVKVGLEKEQLNVANAELGFIPTQTIAVTSVDTAKRVLKLVDDLEELDDVVAVYSNFDIPEAILESI